MPDPEIPVVSVVDLGIVRAVTPERVDDHPDLYRLSGDAGDRARHPRCAGRRGLSARAIETVLSPPWTTDWISESGKAKLHAYGIAPPERRARRPPVRNAARPTRKRSAASARRPARRSGAAGPASSPSTGSSATELSRMSVVPQADVAEVVDETARPARSASRCPASLRETFLFRPGQHLTLKAEIGARRSGAITRSASRPRTARSMVTVKRIAGGVFSNWANEQLKPGDAIEVMPPHGSFTWEFSEGAAQPLCRLRRRLGDHAGHLAAEDGLADRAAKAASPCSTAIATASSIIFLDALARLKNRFMDRLRSPSFPRRGGGGIRAVQRHARPRQMRRDAGDPGRSGRRRPPSSSAAPGR